MTRIEYFWFDFGGVLSPPIADIFELYQRKTGIPPYVLKAAMKVVGDDMGLPPLAPIETAIITEVEWGVRVRAALMRDYPHLDLSSARLESFGEQWFSGVLANAGMIRLVKALTRRGKRVGILTNNVMEWEPYWREMLNLNDAIDLIVDSSRERRRKPDPEFFNIASSRAEVSPKACLLIDDLPENVDKAKSLGWQVINFKTNRQVRAELNQMLESVGEEQLVDIKA